MAEPELRREALRINRRYVEEVVEAFDLCPWARGTTEGTGLWREVFFDFQVSADTHETVHLAIERLVEQHEISVALLIFPNLGASSREFRALVSAMETRHAGVHPRHDVPLAMAAFHPEARADTSSAARLVPFVRRSPDPTIQVVRRSAMTKVRERADEGSIFAENLDAFLPLLGKTPRPSVSMSIALTNLATVERVGAHTVEAIFEDIARDRAASYAKARSQT